MQKEKKDKKGKGFVNSLALLANEAFQLMHMLQLHILYILNWLEMLELALHLICVRHPRASRGTQLPVQAGFLRHICLTKQKGQRAFSGPEKN